MNKRITSIAVAASMLFSSASICANAEGVTYEPSGAGSIGKIQFDMGDWNHDDKVAFYIWDETAEEFCSQEGWSSDNRWGSKKLQGDPVEGEDGIVESYEIDLTGRETHSVFVIFHDRTTNAQTYDLVLTPAAFGHKAYMMTDELLENPVDEDKTCLPAAFEGIDPSVCGPHKKITGTGNIVGSCFAPGDVPAKSVAKYLFDHIYVMTRYGAECCTRDIISNALTEFGVTAEDVLAEYQKIEGYETNEDHAKWLLGLSDDEAFSPAPTFEYEIISGSDAKITAYNGNREDVTIPNMIGGKTVTAIGDYAFAENKYVQRVRIYGLVESIGEGAFFNCLSLKYVDLPQSLTKIGDSAFFSCAGLKITSFPQALTSIGQYAFSNCGSLVYIDLPESLTAIGDGAFSSCDSLYFIIVPDSVTSLEDFLGSTHHTVVCSSTSAAAKEVGEQFCAYTDNGSYFSTSPLTNGDEAVTGYMGYSKFERVCIPTESEGKKVFGIYASKLFVQTNEVFYDGIDRGWSEEYTETCRVYSVFIPEGISAIQKNVFSGSEVGEVFIPRTVVSISDDAFDNCRAKIICYPNSKAESYAKDHNIEYELVEYPGYSYGYFVYLKDIPTLVGDTDTDTSTDTSTDTAVDTSTDTAIDTSTDTAIDTSTDTSIDTVVDTSTDTAVDTGTDTAVDTSTDTAVDTSTDTAVDTSTDTAIDTSTDTSTDTVTDTSTDTATDTSTDTAVDTSTETTDSDKSHTPGDINGDGKVNMKDLTRLHQYINGWNVEVVEAALDVNGDGKVNMKDLTRLHQYLNGWDVAIN